jgi:hypothetical protein
VRGFAASLSVSFSAAVAAAVLGSALLGRPPLSCGFAALRGCVQPCVDSRIEVPTSKWPVRAYTPATRRRPAAAVEPRSDSALHRALSVDREAALAVSRAIRVMRQVG